MRSISILFAGLLAVRAGACGAAASDAAASMRLPSPQGLLARGAWSEPNPLLGPRSASGAQRHDVAANRLVAGTLGGALQQGGASSQSGADVAGRKRYVLPVLLSVAVPGAGEIATGHWLRGLPLVAADVATWVGLAHFQQQGREWRSKYESFADEHWSYAQWQDSLKLFDGRPLRPGISEPVFYDPLDSSDSCVCAWIGRDQDRQHYYENIGKYRYYWMGWDDWSYNPDSPSDSDSKANRGRYYDMRNESNDNFDRATNMIVLAMATRLASVVQTVFLVRGDLQHERHLELRPLRTSGRGAGLELTYRY